MLRTRPSEVIHLLVGVSYSCWFIPFNKLIPKINEENCFFIVRDFPAYLFWLHKTADS
jgi:hypothetical protein